MRALVGEPIIWCLSLGAGDMRWWTWARVQPLAPVDRVFRAWGVGVGANLGVPAAVPRGTWRRPRPRSRQGADVGLQKPFAGCCGGEG